MSGAPPTVATVIHVKLAGKAVKFLMYAVAGLAVLALVTVLMPQAMFNAIGDRLGRLNPLATTTVDRSGAAMLERIRNLEEFTAAEANFTQDVDIEEDSWMPSFVHGESVVAIVTGKVRASVDLGGLDEGAITVDEATKTITVQLPDPELGEAELDAAQTRVIDRDRGVMNRVGDVFAENPTDDTKIFATAEKKMAEAAEGSDLMDRAYSNTETWFSTFLGAAGFDTVVVRWPADANQ